MERTFLNIWNSGICLVVELGTQSVRSRNKVVDGEPVAEQTFQLTILTLVPINYSSAVDGSQVGTNRTRINYVQIQNRCQANNDPVYGFRIQCHKTTT